MLSALLSNHLSLPAGKLQLSPVGGGSINQTYRLRTPDGQLFCKANSAVKFPQLFEKEKEGLETLAACNCIRTPDVIARFEAEGTQVLLMQWVEQGQRTTRFWNRFGEALAALHHSSHHQFGFPTDNYMGSVPQSNAGTDRWTDFFRDQRLRPLVERCEQKQQLSVKHRSQFEQLYRQLDNVFDAAEPPALLHGDLWSGNFLCDENEQPVLIDPAVYYGHRSTDLAMTTLFGQFDPAFYASYQYHYPLPANYRLQWDVCNLYPLLIHLYLFGSSYLRAVERTLQQFSTGSKA